MNYHGTNIDFKSVIVKRMTMFLRKYLLLFAMILITQGWVVGQCFETADSLYRLAEQHYKDGNLAQAGALFMETADVEIDCPTINYENLSMELTNAAFCFEAANDLPSATMAYSKLFIYAKREADSATIANTYLNRAKLAMFTDDIEQAIVFTDSAYYVFSEIGNYTGLAAAAELKADQLLYKGQADEALSLLRNSFSMLKSNAETVQDAASISKKMGFLNKKYQKTDSAIAYFKWSLDYYESEGNSELVSELALELGNAYSGLQNKVAALEYYGIAHESFVVSDDNLGIAICLNQRGKLMADLGRIAEGMADLAEAETLFIKLNHIGGLASVKSNKAGVFNYTSQYDSALVYYTESRNLFLSINDTDNANRVLNNIANIYISKSEYNKAVEAYREALRSIPEDKAGDKSAVYNGLGAVYSSWGISGKALGFYKDALSFANISKDPVKIAVARNNIGGVYQTMGDYGLALQEFNHALLQYSAIGLLSKEVIVHINIGSVLQVTGQYDLALISFNNALQIAERILDKSSIAACNDYMATIYQKKNEYTFAEQLFLKAIEIRREIGERERLAHSLNNLAVLYIEQDNYLYAVSLLEESVAIIELLRLDASEDVRREYFSTQIFSYQNLIIAHVNLKNLDMAYYSKAKHLADKIAKGDEFTVPNLGVVQAGLRDNQIAFVFATTDIYDITQMVITNSVTDAVLQSKEVFLRNLLQDDAVKKTVVAGLDKREIIALRNFVDMKDSVESLDRHVAQKVFYNVVKSYVELINHPDYRNIKKTRAIGAQLYQFLLAPFADKLEGKDEILLITDGILSYLPFESLVYENRKYITEKYKIKYLHSFTIQHLLDERETVSHANDFIAFGVSDYSHTFSDSYTANGGSPSLDKIQRQFWKWSNKSDLRVLYASLNYSRFSDLEYSKIEVDTLTADFAKAISYCNNDATETNLLRLSTAGILANYKYLHFSVHGISVAEIPEMSALVLHPGEGSDGFLTMEEISNLKLTADLVSLSACNTGIGKMYSGEGVVGIAQSFFIAGAHALLATLWEVDEESTAAFMQSFYRYATQYNGDFSEALAQTKRDFIAGKHGYAWTLPYFWAPFVLYGN